MACVNRVKLDKESPGPVLSCGKVTKAGSNVAAFKWSNFREITPQRADEFLRKGFKRRHFFSHRIYHLTRPGPDALKLSQRMCGEGDRNKQWEIILNSAPHLIDEFPPS